MSRKGGRVHGGRVICKTPCTKNAAVKGWFEAHKHDLTPLRAGTPMNLFNDACSVEGRERSRILKRIMKPEHQPTKVEMRRFRALTRKLY